MSLRTLVEKLTAFRCERPSEWLMDEYIRDATALESEIERLNAEVAMLRDALPNIREELRACQAVIHLAGGFDPAYVEGAKAAMSVIDNLLSSKTSPSNWLSKHDAKVRQAGYDQAMKEVSEIAPFDYVYQHGEGQPFRHEVSWNGIWSSSSKVLIIRPELK